MITTAYKDYDNIAMFKKAWQLEAKQTQEILNNNWSRGGLENIKPKAISIKEL